MATETPKPTAGDHIVTVMKDISYMRTMPVVTDIKLRRALPKQNRAMRRRRR